LVDKLWINAAEIRGRRRGGRALGMEPPFVRFHGSRFAHSS
jgi:hypothetical protein